MGLKMLTNPSAMEAKLTQVGDRAVKGMSERMRRHAIMIRDLARSYAPVKTGLLERSIDYAVIRDGRRNGYVVFIDLDAVKYTAEGKSIILGSYASLMEDRLRPHGRMGPELHLGTLSKAKAAGGKKVGGRFLSRAINEGLRNIKAEMQEAVNRAIHYGPSSVGVSNRRQRYNENDYE